MQPPTRERPPVFLTAYLKSPRTNGQMPQDKCDGENVAGRRRHRTANHATARTAQRNSVRDRAMQLGAWGWTNAPGGLTIDVVLPLMSVVSPPNV